MWGLPSLIAVLYYFPWDFSNSGCDTSLHPHFPLRTAESKTDEKICMKLWFGYAV